MKRSPKLVALYEHVNLLALKNLFFASLLTTLKEALVPASGEEKEEVLLSDQLKPGQIILEVGANTGGSSKYICRKVGESGRLISLEPNPIAFRQLVTLRRKYKNLLAVNMAASNNAGSAHLYLEGTSGGTGLIRHVGTKSVLIRISPIDLLVDQLKISSIDGIVIDAEGSEADILKGAPRTLAKAGFVAVEVHHFIDEKLGRQVDDLLAQSGLCCVKELVECSSPYITFRLYVKGITSGGIGIKTAPQE